MKISKKDALTWFSFFAQLPEEEPLLVRQQEIAYAVMAQIEAAVEQRRAVLKANIPGGAGRYMWGRRSGSPRDASPA